MEFKTGSREESIAGKTAVLGVIIEMLEKEGSETVVLAQITQLFEGLLTEYGVNLRSNGLSQEYVREHLTMIMTTLGTNIGDAMDKAEDKLKDVFDKAAEVKESGGDIEEVMKKEFEELVTAGGGEVAEDTEPPKEDTEETSKEG